MCMNGLLVVMAFGPLLGLWPLSSFMLLRDHGSHRNISENVQFLAKIQHAPSRDGSLRCQLILLIFHNRESSFLQNAMHGAYPFTMWHRVYYSGIQQFDNLLLHHITHSMAQPSLMLYDWLVLLLELYTMCAKSGANTFQVINRVADHLFVLLQ